MSVIIINDPSISVGITDDNVPVSIIEDSSQDIIVTTSDTNIPVITYGSSVYTKNALGSDCVAKVLTLSNSFKLNTLIVVKSGFTINPNQYTVTSTGSNDTITFGSSIDIFSDDSIFIVGFS